MPVITSTEYYRNNKESGVIMHKCPHCDFTTPYNKSNLTNHINAKHTPESERPFQCTHCVRGFSQKSHLIKHLQKEHSVDTTTLEKKITNILYTIIITNKTPRSKKTKARRKYYENNKIIKSRDLKKNMHEYYENTFLCNNDLHYDEKKGFIKIHKTLLTGCIKIKSTHCKCAKICSKISIKH